MIEVLHYDDAATRRLLAVYQTPDVSAQREAFVRALAPQRGERVLDIGAGPGYLAASIADAVGTGGAVCGVDISAPLLHAARRQCGGRPQLRFAEGDATRLPADDAAFDAVVCTQVLEYVADADAALAEMHRVVRPGGRVVIVDTDWDSIVWAAPDPARLGRVLAAWDAHAADVHLPRTLAGRLGRAGLSIRDVHVLPLLNAAYREDSYSHRMIDLIADFLARSGGPAAAEARAWVQDMAAQAASGQWFFSLNRYLFLAERPLA
jgi:SAM-dependent methyltransferase